MKNAPQSIALACGMFLALSATAETSLDELIQRELPSLVETYQRLHAAPELSHHEEKTSAFLAKELRALGFDTTERVGKYANSAWTCYGVVAVLKNGDGPTVLARTDLDGLPVEEKTGVAYASKAKAKSDSGEEVAAMHACGHDIHITSLLGSAQALVQIRDQWRGTLVLIGQPAEEPGHGAKALLDDGLYTRFPKPDFALALHDNAELETGKVGVTPGYLLSSATTIDITVRGIGGHGAWPEKTKDPVVAAAQIILALQTIVSRENSPRDPVVITVGSIHGGLKPNIIPDEVKLQLTVRAYKEEVRLKLVAAIERVAKGIAAAAGIPDDRAPIVKVAGSTPATYSDPALTQRLTGVFEKALGAENVARLDPVMGSEDFARFGLEGHQIPICLFWVGAADPAKVAASQKSGVSLPSLHSPLFAPVPEPTIRTAVKAMTSAVVELMK
jgi:hippurate hydrolase